MLILFLQMNMKLKVCTIRFSESINTIKNNVDFGAITLGSKGAIVFENKLNIYRSILLKSWLIQLVQVIYLLQVFVWFFNKYSIEKCGHLGNKAASEIIKHIGARPKISLKSIL